MKVAGLEVAMIKKIDTASDDNYIKMKNSRFSEVSFSSLKP